MSRRLGAALFALLPGLAHAACLALTAQDGAPLARIASGDGTFAITYMHSVTRTPVVERYRIEDGALVEVEMRFAQHGPGLPTEADAGHRITRDADGFVVTMARRFPSIVLRVHRDQSPTLSAGGREVDLAAWGNRAVTLAAAACGPDPR
ncbi:MAG: DUF1850 domain-containing protein [Burkholderiales bacterium]